MQTQLSKHESGHFINQPREPNRCKETLSTYAVIMMRIKLRTQEFIDVIF